MNELFWIDKSPFDPVLERYLDASWDIPSRARHCRLARSLKATANTCTKQNVKVGHKHRQSQHDPSERNEVLTVLCAN